ncbi:hypothetical protein BpHYR1_006510 [Brachionus plicatilis]|uniref:Uncharacterized protein n=1 Tax=Brachionus plicatilis TaxID=10195 RepID=A0A3M7R8F2_BRAPC|nr:hypothetical protein BpHYR1_006510 [Brachionus plicatilis]
MEQFEACAFTVPPLLPYTAKLLNMEFVLNKDTSGTVQTRLVEHLYAVSASMSPNHTFKLGVNDENKFTFK